MIKIGDNVRINSRNYLLSKYNGMIGIVEDLSCYIGVKIVGISNPKSSNGLFYVSSYDFKTEENSPRYSSHKNYLPEIKNVIFNEPATIILWEDGTKTVVKCQNGDKYSREVGMALCVAKKAFGNTSSFNDIFKKWIDNDDKT